MGAQHKLAGLAVGRILAVIFAVLAGDARIEAGAHLTHAAGTGLREDAADDEIGLGRAVTIDQADAGALFERGEQMRGHAGRQRETDGVRTLVGRRLTRQQDRHHGAEQIGDAGAMRRSGVCQNREAEKRGSATSVAPVSKA